MMPATPLRLITDVPDEFLVMNGDLLTDISYRGLFQSHRKSGAAATIAVAAREERIDYREKPVNPYYVSMGINVITNRALRRVPPAGRYDMPELMLALHRGGDGVHCYRTDSYWQDIGRFDDYTRASEDFVNHPERFLRGTPPVTG
jgi:NDP-sugar pyrophosphorylase family protein